MRRRNDDNDSQPNRDQVGLDDALRGRFPQPALNAINKMYAEEITEWTTSNFGVRITVRDGVSNLNLKLRIKIRQLLAIIGGSTTIITITASDTNIEQLAWDTITNLVSNIANKI